MLLQNRKRAESMKCILGFAILTTLVGCGSVGSYSAETPDLFVGKIQLVVVNLGPRDGTYTDKISAIFENKESEALVWCPLGHDGFFETSALNKGDYVLKELFVDQLAVPHTRSFHVPFKGIEFPIEEGQVNVFGDMVLTIDFSGKSKLEFDYRTESLKALYAMKAPQSQWLGKPWRSVFPVPH